MYLEDKEFDLWKGCMDKTSDNYCSFCKIPDNEKCISFPDAPEWQLDSFKRKYANTGKSGYGNAFAEISDGQKKSCWSWWIWPVSNNDAFGRSKNRKLWSLSDEECRDFILDQGLGPKWLAIMNEAHRQVIEEGKSLNQIAGYPKGLWQSDLWALLHSCELFNMVVTTVKFFIYKTFTKVIYKKH